MSKRIPTELIAPCGMNCRLCWGYIREKNTCPGCLSTRNHESKKSSCRSTCTIKNCETIRKNRATYCSENFCEIFPCSRLKQLDKRYQGKYGMSMIANLKMIDAIGTEHFIQNEIEKWTCPECGELICVHKTACISCGYEWLEDKP